MKKFIVEIGNTPEIVQNLLKTGTVEDEQHWLMSYDEAKQIRLATVAELAASIEAAKHDGGAGVIVLDDGTRAYAEI